MAMASRLARLKRAWPWLVGIAIVVAIATRIPFAAFRDAMGQGPLVQMLGVELVITLAVLCTDSFSTWVGLIALRMRRPLKRVASVRGATYLLFLINYALGQGGFGYFLHRTGETPARATGATLFLIGTNFATLLVLTTACVIAAGGGPSPALAHVLYAACAAFAVYLVVIALSPGFLARRGIFAPLFEAGLRGHAIAIAGRLPHVTMVVLGNWIAMRAWGLDLPLGDALLFLPAVAIATVLPISPGGLGTTQAAIVYFFAAWAPGATTEAREAYLFAFGVVHFVYGMIASIAVGVVCLPIVKRAGVLPETTPQPAPDVEPA
jgi:hypothetical protein